MLEDAETGEVHQGCYKVAVLLSSAETAPCRVVQSKFKPYHPFAAFSLVISLGFKPNLRGVKIKLKV